MASGLDGAEDGGLEAGERKIEAINLRMWERVFSRVTIESGLSDRGAARVGKAEDLGDFVEAFTDGVVAGGADDVELIMSGHVDDLGVAAGDDEGEKWEGGGGVRLVVVMEPVGVDVGLEMVDGVKGFMPENGEHAGGQGADEEGTQETRGVGNGNVIDIVLSEMGVGESLVDDGKDGFEMGTGGDFGDYATISGENINLRNDDIADDYGIVANDGGSGFVTGTFDSEDFHIIYYSMFWGMMVGLRNMRFARWSWATKRADGIIDLFKKLC